MRQPSKAIPVTAAEDDLGAHAPIAFCAGTDNLRAMLRMNPFTGSAAFTFPVPVSPGRNSFTPKLGLSSGSGSKGIFGLGWSLSLPQITRQGPLRAVPTFSDEEDVFWHSFLDDLVPQIKGAAGENSVTVVEVVDGIEYTSFVPRVISGPSGILKVQMLREVANTENVSWRLVTGDNVTSTFGTSDASRVFDHDVLASTGRRNIVTWLLDAEYDGRGNAMSYEYREEDDDGVDLTVSSFANREKAFRNNRHLLSVRYGNRTPNRDPLSLKAFHPSRLARKDWLFELCFDYGQFPHEINTTTFSAKSAYDAWPARIDPFSTYRNGFEIRTHRLCRRLLMFHHMPEKLRHDDTLVSATEIEYRLLNGLSLVSGIRHVGYTVDPDQQTTYISQPLPLLTFDYTGADGFNPITGEMANNGFNGAAPRWINLNGDGIPVLLSRGRGAWYTLTKCDSSSWTNSSSSSAEPATPGDNFIPVSQIPNELGMLYDVDDDGLVDQVTLEGSRAGFYGRTEAGVPSSWAGFNSFPNCLNLRVPDTDLHLVDLTGNGNTDMLFSQGQYLAWSTSLGTDGFTEPMLAAIAADEASVPQLVDLDGTQAIHLADMTGDGLSDIVRVRSSDVTYWPNLGRGKFGPGVIMDGAPVLSSTDEFSPRRVLLMDVDGSGFADLVYLGAEGGLSLYMNEGGNRWADARQFEGFPPLDHLSSVAVVDILGNGSSSLVWSSKGLGKTFYVHLLGGVRSRLLSKVANGLGLEMTLDYSFSAQLAAEDKERGTPWITNIPFSVPCVSRVTEFDIFTKRRSVRAFTYRHCYYDADDRELRGFGAVEEASWDELIADPSTEGHLLKTPVSRRKAWYSTGMLVDGEELNSKLSPEFYRPKEPLMSIYAPKSSIDGMPAAATPLDVRRAFSAFKGQVLRIEEYHDDKTALVEVPVLVRNHSYTISCRQPGQCVSRPGVFSVMDREAVTYSMERQDDGDWRITHSGVLNFDEYLHITETYSIKYGKRQWLSGMPASEAVATIQRHSDTSIVVYNFTNAVATSEVFLSPRECERWRYHYVGLISAPEEMTVTNVKPALEGFKEVPFEFDFSVVDKDEEQQPRKILGGHMKTIFWNDKMDQALTLGTIETLALPSHTLTAAYTEDFLTEVYANKERRPYVDIEVIRKMLDQEGYILERDGTWWRPSTKQSFLKGGEGQEDALRRFFAVVMEEDALGNKTTYQQDDFSLFIVALTDPASLTASKQYDYAVQRPSIEVDINGNMTARLYDAHGDLVKSAAVGKDKDLAHILVKSTPLFDAETLSSFLDDPMLLARKLLGNATSLILRSFLYTPDTRVSQPNFVASIDRQLPESSPVDGHIFITIYYLDGAQRCLDTAQTSGSKASWRHSAWRVRGGSGETIKLFEPRLSSSPAPLLQPYGRATTFFYDSVGRTVGALYIDRSWSKNEYFPWKSVSWEPSDLGLVTAPEKDPLLGAQIVSLCSVDEYSGGWAGYSEDYVSDDTEKDREAALKARKDQGKVYAGTPATRYLSSGGGVFAMQQTDGYDEEQITINVQDVQGHRRMVIDPRGLVVQTDLLDMAGQIVQQTMADSGWGVSFYDALGQKRYVWNGTTGARFQFRYDSLQRLTSKHWGIATDATGGSPDELTIETRTYGDNREIVDGADKNLLGQLYRVCDQSGERTYARRDITYHVTEATQALATVEKDTFWGDVAKSGRKMDAWRTTYSTYDLHGRTLSTTDLEKNMTIYGWDEGGFLRSIRVEASGLASAAVDVVRLIEYDARGRMTAAEYGNGTTARYFYYELSMQLRERVIFSSSTQSKLEVLQYQYDIAGNITSLRKQVSGVISDAPDQTGVDSQRMDYAFDAFDRLVRASGRELSSSGSPVRSWPHGPPGSAGQPPTASLPLELSGSSPWQRVKYQEDYGYDRAGNLIELEHRILPTGTVWPGEDKALLAWSRTFTYADDSNRLITMLTTVEADASASLIQRDTFRYDSQGNVMQDGDSRSMKWDGLSQLAASKINNTVTFSAYDSSGQRSRRSVLETDGKNEKPVQDTFYFKDGYQVRLSARPNAAGSGAATPSRTTRKIMAINLPELDEPCAMLEVEESEGTTAKAKMRYQVRDHLGSVGLELDERGHPISYEEFSSYGSSTLRLLSSSNPASDAEEGQVTEKLASYTGRELDLVTGTGLSYHCRRYYAPWAARWISADPIGTADGPNVYAYVNSNPVSYSDPVGTMRGLGRSGGFSSGVGSRSPMLPPRTNLFLTANLNSHLNNKRSISFNIPSWVKGNDDTGQNGGENKTLNQFSFRDFYNNPALRDAFNSFFPNGNSPFSFDHVTKAFQGLFETSNRSFNEAFNRAFNETFNGAFNETFNGSFNDAFNKTFNETFNKTFNETFNKTFNEAFNWAAGYADEFKKIMEDMASAAEEWTSQFDFEIEIEFDEEELAKKLVDAWDWHKRLQEIYDDDEKRKKRRAKWAKKQDDANREARETLRRDDEGMRDRMRDRMRGMDTNQQVGEHLRRQNELRHQMLTERQSRRMNHQLRQDFEFRGRYERQYELRPAPASGHNYRAMSHQGMTSMDTRGGIGNSRIHHVRLNLER